MGGPFVLPPLARLWFPTSASLVPDLWSGTKSNYWFPTSGREPTNANLWFAPRDREAELRVGAFPIGCRERG